MIAVDPNSSSQVGGSNVSDPTEADLHGQAASLGQFGTGEAVIAEASVALDQQQQRAQDHRRRAQELARQQALDRIHDMRHAATMHMISGLLQASGQLVEGALKIGEGCRADGSQGAGRGWQGLAAGLGIASQGATSVLGREEAMASANAAHHELISQEYRDEANDDDQQVRQVQSMRDRALSHLDEVSRARNQARLAALRG